MSLGAHKSFHKATIGTLSMYLDTELIRSNKVNTDALKNYNKAMLDEIKKIYSNTTTTEVDKKVAEGESRQKIEGFIVKAKENYKKRTVLITKEKSNLLEASENFLQREF